MIKLDEILSGPIKGRKTSQLTPNLANAIEWRLAPLLAVLPTEVSSSPHVWLSGSRVSSIVLGVPCPESADLDLFVTREAELAELRSRFQRGSIAEFTERPAENLSNARGVGFKVTLESGLAIDVWYEVQDPFQQIRLYPGDGYAHVRMAYNPLHRALIVVANEVA